MPQQFKTNKNKSNQPIVNELYKILITKYLSIQHFFILEVYTIPASQNRAMWLFGVNMCGCKGASVFDAPVHGGSVGLILADRHRDRIKDVENHRDQKPQRDRGRQTGQSHVRYRRCQIIRLRDGDEGL